jgi:hypothetical protein
MRFSLAPFSLRFLFFVFQDGAVWVPYINNPFFEGVGLSPSQRFFAGVCHSFSSPFQKQNLFS